MTTTRLKRIPIVMCLALALAACGSDGAKDANVTTAAAPTTTPETSPPEADTTAPSGAADTTTPVATNDADVILTQSTFGPILTDRRGSTLYMFSNDTPTSATCTGGCASAWPAFLFQGTPTVGEGLNPDLFTSVDGEGGPQLAYNGHPLYYFAGDSAPGDTNGQGSGGVWFILDADGNQITA